jgi:hypothetical protein
MIVTYASSSRLQLISNTEGSAEVLRENTARETVCSSISRFNDLFEMDKVEYDQIMASKRFTSD